MRIESPKNAPPVRSGAAAFAAAALVAVRPGAAQPVEQPPPVGPEGDPAAAPATERAPEVRGVRGRRVGRAVDPDSVPEAWWDRPFLLDVDLEDGTSLRGNLQDAGVQLFGTLAVDAAHVFDGGVDRGTTIIRLIDVGLELDLERLVHLPGVRFVVDAYSVNPDSLSNDVGDVQVGSNLETGFAVDQIAEIWAEWAPPGTPWRLKAGKIEANEEFAYVASGTEFLHSSAGFSPTIVGFPSYPDPAFGIVVEYARERDATRFGYFDGSLGAAGIRTGSRGPRGFLQGEPVGDRMFLLEYDRRWDRGAIGDGGARLAVGGWYHTGDFDRLDGNGIEDGAWGVYGVFEQRLWTRDASSPGAGGLDGFLQYGFAEAVVSEVEHHAGAGLRLNGTLPGRDRDALGVYASLAILSEEAGPRDEELALEGFYLWQLSGSIAIKPAVQYVVNPGGDAAIDDAIVGILRVEFSF